MTPLPPLLLLTDRSQLRLGRGLVRTVAECAEAGLTHVVLRELDLPSPQRAALAAELMATGVVVIAAHEAVPGVAGVHLSATALAESAESAEGPRQARRTWRGRSCHTRADVVAAAAEGFDYVTLGPFAATASKPGYGPALAPADYADHPIPVYALGGIEPANAELALDAGAYGVAVMGGVMRAASPKAVVRDLLTVVG